MYKQLGIKFHRYLYHEGDEIEFIATEIAETGEQMDIAVKVNGKWIHLTEFMAKALSKKKMHSLFNYHDSMRNNPEYKGFEVKSSVQSIANPKHGINIVEIDKRIIFHIDVEFMKNRDGWEVLNTISNKVESQEELSDDEAIDLLILPDMDIDMPIKELMTSIINLIAKANIPDKSFKSNIYCCLVKVLARFFSDDEWNEMVNMLKTLTSDEKVEFLTKNYGAGFAQEYLNGKEDGFVEGNSKGFNDAKLDDARKLLAEGVDEEIIARCTGITTEKLKELKRKF